MICVTQFQGNLLSFQREFVPQEYDVRNKDLQKSRISCPSYWADFYDQFDVQKCERNNFKIDVESHWRKI